MSHIKWCTGKTKFDANEEGGQIDDMVSASGDRAALSSVSVLPTGVFAGRQQGLRARESPMAICMMNQYYMFLAGVPM